MARAWSRWSFGVNGFVFGLLVAVALTTGAVIIYWQTRSHAAQAEDTQTVYLRDDFSASVLGKSEDQVIEAVGKPDMTSEDAEATYWHYRRRTKNPTTGQTDSDVQVVFEKGRVTALNY